MKVNLDFFERSNLNWLKDRTVFLVIHGSHCYGTNIETSDVDLKGIAIPPKEYFFGYLNHFEQAEFKEPDTVIYDIRKILKLATDANPNIIEILFSDPSMYLIKHPIMDELIKNKNLFISKKARWTFSGYAHSQLKRLKGHYQYLKNPPTHKPTRDEFDLPERTTIPKDQLKAAEALITKKMDEWNFDFDCIKERDKRLELQRKIHETLFEIAGASIFLENEKLWKHAAVSTDLVANMNVIEIVNKEKRYKSKLKEWHAYNKWKEERNPQRAELEAKFGYNSKHAMHLVRLMRMCEEIISTGEIRVKRPDAKELLEIRDGAWSYEDLIAWSEQQELKIQKLYDNTNVVPKEPNRKEIEKLCRNLVETYLYAT